MAVQDSISKQLQHKRPRLFVPKKPRVTESMWETRKLFTRYMPSVPHPQQLYYDVFCTFFAFVFTVWETPVIRRSCNDVLLQKCIVFRGFHLLCLLLRYACLDTSHFGCPRDTVCIKGNPSRAKIWEMRTEAHFLGIAVDGHVGCTIFAPWADLRQSSALFTINSKVNNEYPCCIFTWWPQPSVAYSTSAWPCVQLRGRCVVHKYMHVTRTSPRTTEDRTSLSIPATMHLSLSSMCRDEAFYSWALLSTHHQSSQQQEHCPWGAAWQ